MAKRKKRPNLKRGNREDRIQKRKQAVVTYFIVILMVASVAGFAISSNQMNSAENIDYDGYEFNQVVVPHPLAADYTINAFTEKESGVLFYASPYQVELIPTEGNLSATLGNVPYYGYLFNPGTEYAPLHDWMRFELSSQTNKIFVPVVTQLNETYPNTPVASCANATLDEPIVFVTFGNSTAINITDTGCIQIESRLQDVLLIRDRILYTLTGIMNT